MNDRKMRTLAVAPWSPFGFPAAGAPLYTVTSLPAFPLSELTPLVGNSHQDQTTQRMSRNYCGQKVEGETAVDLRKKDSVRAEVKISTLPASALLIPLPQVAAPAAGLVSTSLNWFLVHTPAPTSPALPSQESCKVRPILPAPPAPPLFLSNITVTNGAVSHQLSRPTNDTSCFESTALTSQSHSLRGLEAYPATAPKPAGQLISSRGKGLIYRTKPPLSCCICNVDMGRRFRVRDGVCRCSACYNYFAAYGIERPERCWLSRKQQRNKKPQQWPDSSKTQQKALPTRQLSSTVPARTISVDLSAFRSYCKNLKGNTSRQKEAQSPLPSPPPPPLPPQPTVSVDDAVPPTLQTRCAFLSFTKTESKVEKLSDFPTVAADLEIQSAAETLLFLKHGQG